MRTAWAKKHLDWIRTQRFEQSALRFVLDDYLKMAEDLSKRVGRLTRAIQVLVARWNRAPLIKALLALRGINVVSAVVLAAELGELASFETAPQVMGYLGVVPSERSRGETRQQGPIPRTGNGHPRRIRRAWAYRFRAARTPAFRTPSSTRVSDEVDRIVWRAQVRLCDRYRRTDGAWEYQEPHGRRHRARAQICRALTRRTSEGRAGGRPWRPKGEYARVPRPEPRARCPRPESGSLRRTPVMREPTREDQSDPPSLLAKGRMPNRPPEQSTEPAPRGAGSVLDESNKSEHQG